MGDDWDDLFAKAEGKIPQGSKKHCSDSREEIRDLPQVKRYRKTDPFDDYLKQRSESQPLTTTFTYVQYSKSLVKGCREFQVSNKSNKDSYICTQCQNARWKHLREPSEDQTKNNAASTLPLQVMCCLWNLRSMAKICAKQQQQTREKLIKKQIKIIKRLAQNHESAIPAFMYFQDVITRTETLRALMANQNLPRKPIESNFFEAAIRVIIACDEAYYRLYYSQITEKIFCGEDDVFMIPHPLTYFAEGMDGVDKAEDGCQENVLALLHSYRSLETCDLFQNTGWYNLPTTRIQTEKQLSTHFSKNSKFKKQDPMAAFLEKHETPAPPILMEWRDSCRDFLCHLYAYATISNKSIREIANTLRSMNIHRVVEIGAGTGFLAYLLSHIGGLQVDAFDIAPTPLDSNLSSDNATNEYHGSTPAFLAVQHKKARSKDFIPRTDSPQNVALLLCYPPPQSSMALDSLQQFIREDGHVLIHIGEFKGLTGSDDFERKLSDKFSIEKSIPCLHWGTDAATITIFGKKRKKKKKADKKNTRSSLILPCSACREKEATKRLRLCRELNYCCDVCFLAHLEERRKVLLNFMIEISEKIDFENPQHMMPV